MVKFTPEIIRFRWNENGVREFTVAPLGQHGGGSLRLPTLTYIGAHASSTVDLDFVIVESRRVSSDPAIDQRARVACHRWLVQRTAWTSALPSLPGAWDILDPKAGVLNTYHLPAEGLSILVPLPAKIDLGPADGFLLPPISMHHYRYLGPVT